MDQKIIDGRSIAQKREGYLKREIEQLQKKPKIVSILVGDDPSSLLYTQMKQKKAQNLGIGFDYMHFPAVEPFQNISMTILKLNQDPTVTGIMVQLPLPKEFLQGRSADELLHRIDPTKDVDGLTGSGNFLPAAVKAVMSILEEEQIDVKGKFAVVLGASNLVGKPIAEELKKMGALVTVCDRSTPNIPQITERADIIVSATGSAGILTGNMVKEDVVVIDVGTLVIEDELNGETSAKVVGDVDFETVSKKALKITPVPGGVGPITVISLMENAVKAIV